MFELIQALELTGSSARARAFVPGDTPYLQDHFPGALIVPGTLLIELMAQTAGPLLESACSEPRWAVLGLVRSASVTRPTRLPSPGVTLELRAELLRLEPSRGVARTQVHVDGKPHARAELVFSLQPGDPEWELALAAREARLKRWLAAWEAV